MDTETIQRIAKSATYRVTNNWGDIPPDLIEDCIQEATIAILNTDKDDYRYNWVCARNAVLHFLHKWYNVDTRSGTVELDHDDCHLQLLDNPKQFIFVDYADLVQIFLSVRTKRGDRGENASQIMAKICILIMQGYGNQAIADRLMTTIHSVKIYRRQIKAILRALDSDQVPKLV